ncbi:MAG: hypothetical protein V5A38_10410 [Halolamina sp.]|uniref:hypothetical protein n=1 Tax=Halolamina sp. TaxID=1940283 RepID=UPI002FC27F24
MSDARGDGDESEAPRPAELRETLQWLRNTPSRRRWATNVAIFAGLAFAVVHPIGLLVGGALTALPQRRLSTGLLGGLGFGLFTLAVFGARLAVQGALGTAIATGEIVAVAVATALVLPLLGSLTRGLV